MTDLATLTIRVQADGALRVVDQFGNATERAAKKADELGKSAQRVGAAVGGVLVAGLALAARETFEAQKAQAQLAAVLRSTAGVAGQTAAALGEQNDALRAIVATSGEAVTEVQALLLTFTKIRDDVFPQATALAFDLAQALGTDVKGAALQLGKALNDPVAGVTALSRAGVQLSDSQKATIAGFVQTNQLAKAQSVILAELETQVGGSAAAYRNTLGGALLATRESFLDLFDASGTGMGELIEDINVLADSLAMLPTKIELVKEQFKNLFLQYDAFFDLSGGDRNRGPLAAVARAEGRPAPLTATEQLAQSDATIAALKRLMEEQLRGVAAGAEARRAAGRGRALFGGGDSGAGTGGTDDFEQSLSRLEFAATVGDLLRAQAILRAIATQENNNNAWRLQATGEFNELIGESTNEVIRFGTAGVEAVDALTESARVFAEQSQLALARFASDFLKDGFKSVGRFWDSFTQLGRDAVGQVFAKSVMDKMGGSLTDGIVGLFSKVSPALAVGAGALGGLLVGVSNLLTSSSRSRAAADAAQLEASRQLIASIKAQRDWQEDFLDFSGSETPIEREVRGIRSAFFNLAGSAFSTYNQTNGNQRDLNFDADFLASGALSWEEVMTWVRSIASESGGAAQTLLGQLEQLAAAFERNKEAAAEAETALLRETRARQALTLEQFKDSLALSGQSTLSPVQQLAEAQRQYDAILALAGGGDASAIDSLPETARTLLDAARSVFASGARYADVFGRVNADVEAVLASLRVPLSNTRVAPDGSIITSGTGMLDAPSENVMVEVQSAMAEEQMAQTAVITEIGQTQIGLLGQIVARLDALDYTIRSQAESYGGARPVLS